jgi:hypothetical protein
MEVKMQIVIDWFVMECSLVGDYQSFGETEVIFFSEMLVTTYKTTWCHNPEDHNSQSFLTLQCLNFFICKYGI